MDDKTRKTLIELMRLAKDSPEHAIQSAYYLGRFDGCMALAQTCEIKAKEKSNVRA